MPYPPATEANDHTNDAFLNPIKSLSTDEESSGGVSVFVSIYASNNSVSFKKLLMRSNDTLATSNNGSLSIQKINDAKSVRTLRCTSDLRGCVI